MPSATPPPAREGRRAVSGTEADAVALLGWLTDPEAPRLCLVTGPPGSGKTALLDWLAGHEPRAGRRRRGRTSRVLVPLAGQSALAATWTIADRLGVVARSPGELVQALATGENRLPGRPVLLLTDLHLSAEPAALTDLVGELAGLGRLRLAVETRTDDPAHEVLASVRRARTVTLDAEGIRPPAAPAAGPGTPGRGPTAPQDRDRPGSRPSGGRPGGGSAREPAQDRETGRPGGTDRARAPEPAAGPAGRAGADGGRVPGPAGESAGVAGESAGVAAGPRGGALAPDLSDPLAVCAADPLLVTSAYVTGSGDDRAAGSVDDHGGLRSAWLSAGQSLCRAQSPADRALVLLAALGDGADPRLRPALAELAAGSAWRLSWARHRGDVTPPWPGPVAVLGVADGTLLVGDRTGTVRLLREPDASPAGRLAHSVPGRITALAPAPDGTVLLLDDRGRLHAVRGTAPRPPYLERLTEAVSATLARHPGTALAAIAGSVVVGDRLGSVHAFGLTGLYQTAAHSGRVTAVAAVESETPFVCSGGADGSVRLWTPGRDPRTEPLAERRAPVVSLHATETPHGPLVAAAWADGLVELLRPEGGPALAFRPGPPVRAVAVTGAGALLVGTDESLVRLVPGE
ncbi:hypothetical protein AB0G79_18115 [Streptomyces sp. NPDC020807]|uniref:hypothetical protein n=1 Tax=Streptomyces sp. NPDC020807 TaxID=3155119 RepID=UPI0033F6803F